MDTFTTSAEIEMNDNRIRKVPRSEPRHLMVPITITLHTFYTSFTTVSFHLRRNEQKRMFELSAKLLDKTSWKKHQKVQRNYSRDNTLGKTGNSWETNSGNFEYFAYTKKFSTNEKLNFI